MASDDEFVLDASEEDEPEALAVVVESPNNKRKAVFPPGSHKMQAGLKTSELERCDLKRESGD